MFHKDHLSQIYSLYHNIQYNIEILSRSEGEDVWEEVIIERI